MQGLVLAYMGTCTPFACPQSITQQLSSGCDSPSCDNWVSRAPPGAIQQFPDSYLVEPLIHSLWIERACVFLLGACLFLGWLVAAPAHGPCSGNATAIERADGSKLMILKRQCHLVMSLHICIPTCMCVYIYMLTSPPTTRGNAHFAHLSRTVIRQG